MRETKYAAIDIGSNAVRLLIKSTTSTDPKRANFKKEILLRVPLRLGFDVFTIGELSEKKEERLRRLMKVYAHLMKIYDVKEYRACATSAMRDARNGSSIIKKIAKSTEIEIEIIDGQQEAKMIYNNHIECQQSAKGNFMYVDVGGGSTEINLLCDGELRYSMSYNIGTVRILSDAVKDGAWQRLEDDIIRVTAGMGPINIVGSGGNINRLCRMNDKGSQYIQINALQQIYNDLKALTIEQRIEKYDFKQDRADVIVPAAKIFLTIAHNINAQYIYVPVVGLSDGIIDELYAKDMDKKDK